VGEHDQIRPTVAVEIAGDNANRPRSIAAQAERHRRVGGGREMALAVVEQNPVAREVLLSGHIGMQTATALARSHLGVAEARRQLDQARTILSARRAEGRLTVGTRALLADCERRLGR
jgi:hypothetical protein